MITGTLLIYRPEDGTPSKRALHSASVLIEDTVDGLFVRKVATKLTPPLKAGMRLGDGSPR